jgi:putative endopeptidase
VLRDILEKASIGGADRSAPEQEIGDYYFAFMDERTVARQGYEPIKPERARLDALEKKEDVRDEVPRLHRQGNDAFFEFGSETDLKDRKHTIGGITQGGLGLADRDFYLSDDPIRRHSQSVR